MSVVHLLSEHMDCSRSSCSLKKSIEIMSNNKKTSVRITKDLHPQETTEFNDTNETGTASDACRNWCPNSLVTLAALLEVLDPYKGHMGLICPRMKHRKRRCNDSLSPNANRMQELSPKGMPSRTWPEAEDAAKHRKSASKETRSAGKQMCNQTPEYDNGKEDRRRRERVH